MQVAFSGLRCFGEPVRPARGQRRWAGGAVVLAAAAMVVAIPSASGQGHAASDPPARLLVAATEFRLTLSRGTIRPGVAIVQLENRGEDDHDLRLRRISRPDRPTARWSLTRPGRLSQLDLRLSQGRYRLWCSLPGHRGLGMRAVLRVSRQPRR
jgi:hypothetical protein